MAKTGQIRILEGSQSGQEVAKHAGQAPSSRFHVDYWRQRLYRKVYTRGGVRHEVPGYSVRLQHLGRREAFALDSANAGVAATKAKEIYTHLVANGWDATLAKFKPPLFAKADVCTLGEFLDDVRTHSHLKAITVRRYAIKLRKIVADVAKIQAGLKKKAKLAKHDYATGGHEMWLARVHGQRLDILTPDSVAAWRNGYVASAGIDPLRRKAAERSAASILRCSRALFSADVVGTLKVRLPTNPFAGVKLRDPGPQRYRSDVNPRWLLACAERELSQKRSQEFIALFLCLWAGLRRKEADLLLWEQVDLEEGQIHVRRTPYFEPKTEESQRSIDLAPEAVDVLRSFKAGSQSEFVLDGGDANPSATYDYYRSDHTWRALHAWLKGKGIRERKAIHALRKESGSLVASAFGIEAARQHLGHRDISTTSAHYVDKKRRVEVSLPLGTAGKLKAAK